MRELLSYATVVPSAALLPDGRPLAGGAARFDAPRPEFYRVRPRMARQPVPGMARQPGTAQASCMGGGMERRRWQCLVRILSISPAVGLP